MTAEIIVALITGGLAFAGVVISNLTAAKKTDEQIRIAQAVTDERLSELTREVREHNNFARRLPVVEQQIKDIDRRIEALEEVKKYAKQI